jgi:glycosyltransferase involved in cell wall biosynthesis
MRVLLLTDMPPCRNFTAGIVLEQLCSFLPEGSLGCFAVVNPALNPEVPPSLAPMPMETIRKPRETWGALHRPLGLAMSLLMEAVHGAFTARRIVRRVTTFGRQVKPDVLWCILEGQTMIRLARSAARSLGVPLLTQVWDPPTWWLREHKVNRVAASQVLREFDRAVRASVSCATASWAMAEEYGCQYGTRTVPVIPSLDLSWAHPPAQAPNPGKELTIGVAGQLYASAEWNSLIRALDSAGWRVADREVRIVLLGRYLTFETSKSAHIEYLGWRPQQETIEILSRTDVLYCPYWFDPAFETEARLCFPSKLTTYLAAGRPVLFHGPAYASPSRFLEENKAGVCCNSLDLPALLGHLHQLLCDHQLYEQTARNGRHALELHLSLPRMRESFFSFLQTTSS